MKTNSKCTKNLQSLYKKICFTFTHFPYFFVSLFPLLVTRYIHINPSKHKHALLSDTKPGPLSASCAHFRHIFSICWWTSLDFSASHLQVYLLHICNGRMFYSWVGRKEGYFGAICTSPWAFSLIGSWTSQTVQMCWQPSQAVQEMFTAERTQKGMTAVSSALSFHNN